MRRSPATWRTNPISERARSCGTRGRRASRPERGDAGLDESPHETHWRQLREWKSDRALRRLVSLEVRRVGTADRGGDRVEAAVVLEGGVPHQHPSVELEGGNAVTEGLDRAGCRGANSLAELPQAPAGIGRQRREIGPHLLRRGHRGGSWYSPSRLPAGSRKVAKASPLGPIGVTGVATRPPAAATFLSVASMRSTMTYVRMPASRDGGRPLTQEPLTAPVVSSKARWPSPRRRLFQANTFS